MGFWGEKVEKMAHWSLTSAVVARSQTQTRAVLPPVHDEIRRLRHLRPCRPYGLGIAATERRTQSTSADERWVADNEVRIRPRCFSRIHVMVERYLSSLVRHIFSRNRTFLHRLPIPTSDRLARLLVSNHLLRVVREDSIATLNVLESRSTGSGTGRFLP